MNSRLNTRKQKLSFLKDLSAGRTTVEDMLPPTVEFWTQEASDAWRNEVTGEWITAAQLTQKKERAQKTNSIVWAEEKALSVE